MEKYRLYKNEDTYIIEILNACDYNQELCDEITTRYGVEIYDIFKTDSDRIFLKATKIKR